MANTNIEIGAVGWDRPDPFYPDDLPEDWHLAYYANAYRSVWVPVEVWLGDALPDTAVWREDVDEAFRFVAALDERVSALPAPQAVGTALARLGEQLSAVVASEAVYAAVMPAGSTFTRIDPAQVWSPDAAGSAPIGRLDGATLNSPRAMREVLEAFAGMGEHPHRFLFVDGPLDRLADLRTLGGLMGIY